MMKEKDFERRKRAIWAKHEKTFGQPIKPVIRNFIENGLLHLGFHDSDAEDLDSLVPDYLRLIALWVDNNLPGGNSSRQSDTWDNIPKKRYQKCFERRLHLIGFVGKEFLNLNHLVDQSFTPHKRLKWGPICDKWNKAHPYDPMTSAVLKVEFYRAIAEKDIQREYFVRKEKEIADAMAPMMESLTRLTTSLQPGIEKIVESLIHSRNEFNFQIRALIDVLKAIKNKRELYG
jgi:hypothetical protein